MARVLRAYVWAVAVSIVVGGAALAADPAGAVPADMVVYGELAHEAAQRALGAVAMPPAVGLAPGEHWGRFSHLDDALGLPAGTVEQAALHLDRAAFGAGPGGAMAVLSFEDAFRAASFLPGAGNADEASVTLEGGAAVAARGPMLCVAMPALCQRFLAGGYPTLADQASFREVRTKEAGADAWFYADMPHLLALGRSAGPPSQVQAFEGVLDMFGLANAVSITAQADMDAPAMHGVLRLGEKDKGLLSLLPAGPLDMVSFVPQEPSAALLLEWRDAPTFFDGLMDIVKRLDTKYGDPEAEQEIALFEQKAGLKLADFVKTLGPGLAVYLPAPGDDGMLHVQQAVAVLPLRDRGAFSYDVPRIVTAATGIGPMPQSFGDKRGFKLTRAPLVMAVLDDRAVIGLDRPAVEGYLKWAASGGPAMAEKAPDACAMLYLDAGLLLKSYPRPESGAQVLLTLGRQGQDVRFSASVENAKPSVASTYVGITAILAAMTMPALERGRFAARQAYSQNNLHNIGIALSNYVHEHGKYPSELIDILDDENLRNMADKPFLDPNDKTPGKAGPQGIPCSYEYPGPLPADLPPDFVVACTRAGIYPDERIVLLANGRVLYVSEYDLANPDNGRFMSLKRCYMWLLDHHQEYLIPDKEDRLARFYDFTGD